MEPCPHHGYRSSADRLFTIFALNGFTLLHVPEGTLCNRVKMNIPYKPLKIGILIANDGFISVLKKVTMTLVTDIIGYGVACEKASHELG